MHERAEPDRDTRVATPRRVVPAARQSPETAIVALQRTAGNSAVVTALAAGEPLFVQRGKRDRKGKQQGAKQQETTKPDRRQKGKGRAAEKEREDERGEVKPSQEEVRYHAALSYLDSGQRATLAANPHGRALFMVKVDELIDLAQEIPEKVPEGEGESDSAEKTAENDLDYYEELVHTAFKAAAFGPGFDEGGGAHSDWAFKRTTSQHADLRLATNTPWGMQTSLHHKISRHQLRQLHERALDDRDATPFHEYLEGLAGRMGKPTTVNSLRLLQNIPGNLEMGPQAEQRSDDPGPGFDGNYASGALTPRSQRLDQVDKMIDAPEIDWSRVVALLTEAEARHDSQDLSPPNLDLWAKSGSKWHKKTK
ncbi:hypothetical protein [Amycolatopsis sp. EV170708-02-1]|uniref:hypothetical protein n=1 Tax=Amycolatopsis sp. EV170708-02-1 TaxID=2919322 RepID=UPI001F0B92AA|nr:hypothetical protein [Amycolatopsis sp. EV170708-02-1]UMP07244.1 hypothetical protein MJQ72_21610 [Amycolatopsis sp. EV170708-02-1]